MMQISPTIDGALITESSPGRWMVNYPGNSSNAIMAGVTLGPFRSYDEALTRVRQEA